MGAFIPIVEPWDYVTDGVTYTGRKVWHVEPPGPIGSGALYRETRAEDLRAADDVWERHVYEWVPA